MTHRQGCAARGEHNNEVQTRFVKRRSNHCQHFLPAGCEAQPKRELRRGLRCDAPSQAERCPACGSGSPGLDGLALALLNLATQSRLTGLAARP